MRRFLFVFLLGAIIISSCKKTPGETARIALHNATLTIDSLTMFWNGSPSVSNYLAEGKTSGTPAAPYVTVAAGTNNIILKSGTRVLLDKNAYGGVNTSYTLLAYDSTTSASSLNFVFLTDDLSLPDTLYAKYRFINCVDTTVDSIKLFNAADTLTVGTSAFIGPTPAASSLQAFTTVPRGTYQPRIYEGGVAKTYDSVVLGKQKICSLIYSGRLRSSGADSLKLSVIFHPPN